MVAAKPTRGWDLDRVRTHKFNGTRVCQDCRLEISESMALRDLPGCPGPLFRLIYVGGAHG